MEKLVNERFQYDIKPGKAVFVGKTTANVNCAMVSPDFVVKEDIDYFIKINFLSSQPS